MFWLHLHACTYNYCIRFVLQFSGRDLTGEDQTAESIRKQMTDAEWSRIYEMSQDKNLYQNLINSLFPTIHGEYKVQVPTISVIEYTANEPFEPTWHFCNTLLG